MRKATRRNRKGHAIVEFALGLFVVFMCVFVFINVVMITASIAGAYLITAYSAIQASSQSNYDRALASATKDCKQLMNSGFASWVKMKPVGGFAGSGMNLYVEERNQSTQEARTVGPNTPVPAPINITENVYEYTTDCTFEVGPFVNMESFPGLNGIPFVSKAAQLHLTASRAVEHPEGLSGFGTLTSLAKAFNGLPSGLTIDDNGNARWVNPGDNVTQPGSGVSYVLVNDPQGAGAYLLQITLDHRAGRQGSGNNLNFSIDFKGVHLSPSTNGMVNQLEGFVASDASGNATSYTVDPGQEVGIHNQFTVAWNSQFQTENSMVSVQNFVQRLNYSRGAGFLPAVEAGWSHFTSWYGGLAAPSQLDTFANVGYSPFAQGVIISTPGRISDTPVPVVLESDTGFGTVTASDVFHAPLNNNSANTDYGVPAAVTSTSPGMDPARLLPRTP